VVVQPMPVVFPGYHLPNLVVQFSDGVKTYHGPPVVPAAEFFETPVSLVTRRSTRSLSSARSFGDSSLSIVDPTDATTMLIQNDIKISLRREIKRSLTIPDGIQTLFITHVPWLSSVECLQTMSDLTSLVLKDIPIRTLPSFAALSNLNFLTLDQLHEMREMPLGICDAPKLEKLCVFEMINLTEFSVAFIRGMTTTKETLSHPNDPLRLKQVFFDKCSAVVPHEINELFGLQHIRIADCGFNSPVIQRGPNIGLGLGLLTDLTMIGFDGLFVLPDDMSGLTSLLNLSICRVAIDSIPPSIKDLHKLRVLSLNDVNIKTIPKEVGGLKDLRALKVQNCYWLEDSAVNFCEECPRLVMMTFCNCGKNVPVSRTKIYTRLAEMVPLMRGMSVIVIKGAPHEDASALVDGFKAFPSLVLGHMLLDPFCYDYWRAEATDHHDILPHTYTNITPDHFPQMDDLMMRLLKIHPDNNLFRGNTNITTPFVLHNVFALMMGAFIAEERKLLTFSWCLHPRLGGCSPASVLEKHLVDMILKFATGRTSFKERYSRLY